MICQAALACALAAGDPKKATAILTREAGRFPDARAAELVQSWRGRIALARKAHAGAGDAGRSTGTDASADCGRIEGRKLSGGRCLLACGRHAAGTLKFLPAPYSPATNSGPIVAFHMEGLLEIVCDRRRRPVLPSMPGSTRERLTDTQDPR